MPSRKAPPRALSRLDYQARYPLPAAAERVETAPSRFGVTWLSDMLTPETNSFGVVRLLLALAVLVSHSVFLTTGQGSLEPLYRWTNYTLGQHGVQLFFFLSGILVAQSLYKSRSVRDYATARALRIFPALIVCVLLTALVMGPLVSILPPVTYLRDQGVSAYIVKTISLWSGSGQLPGVFATNPVPGVVNTSVWTLKYEALCYAILGAAGLIVFRLQRFREAAIALLAVWAFVVLAKPVGLELHGGAKSSLEVLRYFTMFFGAGVLAFAVRHWIPVHAALLVPLGALFAASIGSRFQEPVAAVALGYLALWIATFRFGRLRAFTNNNDYSYATYLYHMPVAQVLLHIWPDMHVVPLILATTGLVLWLAFLSWELVERPALALRHRLWSTTGDAPAATASDSAVTQRAEAPTLTVAAPDPAVAAAAAAAARAAERLVHQMRATSSAAAVAATTAAPTETEPGRAHVWRPMPSPRKLRISDELPDPPLHLSAPAKAPFASPRTLARPTMSTLKRSAPVKDGPPSAAVDAAIPSVPASRIAFVTKRTVTAPTPPERLDAPGPQAAPIVPTSRAVIAVRAEETANSRPFAHARIAPPRPNWSRPLGGMERPRPV